MGRLKRQLKRQWWQRIVLTLLLLQQVSCVHVVVPEPPLPPAVQQDLSIGGESIYWKLQKGDRRLYILGTFHVGVAPRELPVDIWEGLDASQAAVFEVVDFNLDQEMVIRQSIWMNETRLAQAIGRRNIDRYYRLFLNYYPALARSHVVNLSPFGLYSLAQSITAQPPGQQQNSDPGDVASKLDLFLIEYANARNKQLVGLESAVEQINMLNEGLDKDYFNRLYVELTSPQDSQEDLIKYYRANKPKKITRVLLGSGSKFYQRLIIDRNIEWRDKMLNFLDDPKFKTTFMAVGLGHLPGEKGLISLFRELGYTATPIFK